MSKKLKNKFEPGQNTMHFFAANAFHWQAANDLSIVTGKQS